MSAVKKVVHMTTVHQPFDTRIYHKECLSLKKAGYEVTLIAPADEAAVARSEVRLLPVKKQSGKLLRMLLSPWEAFRIARRLDADYYHIHDPELLPVAWLLKTEENVVVYDVHEDYETSIQQKDYLNKRIAKAAAALYSGMEKTLSEKLELCLAEKYYKDKYPDGKCILNYPVLNEKLLAHQPAEKPDNALLYTGNVSLDRGALQHAALPLLDEKITVHLTGKCPAPLAEQMLETAGAGRDRLTLEGVDRFIEREEIDATYISRPWLAGIALFPPTDHYKRKELTKFFEYMSAGLPIICSNFPIWKDFIEKHRCGIAVNPDSDREIRAAVEYLRTHPVEAREMGRNGKQAVMGKLNWQEQEKELVSWYEEIWAGRGKKPAGQ